VNADTLATHLNRTKYGTFTLTEAVRPGPMVPIRPRQGYRTTVYRDRKAGLRLPMLSAAVSAENLFELFLELLPPLGEVVNVVLESSHGRDADDHVDFRRTDIDLPVLTSHLYEFEELLMNDGCTGVAVLSTSKPMEVQFDEHKLLHIYAPSLKPFRRVLRSFGVRKRLVLPLLSEGEHLHHTTDEHEDQFAMFCNTVGVADFDGVMSEEEWE
jgi:hypothetical protein